MEGTTQDGRLQVAVQLPADLVRIPVRDEKGDELYVVYDSNEKDVQITVWRNPKFGAPVVTLRSGFSSVINIPIVDVDQFIQTLNSRVQLPTLRETSMMDATDVFLHDFFAAGDVIQSEVFRDAQSEIEIALDAGADVGNPAVFDAALGNPAVFDAALGNPAVFDAMETLDVDLSAGIDTSVGLEGGKQEREKHTTSQDFDLHSFFHELRRTPAKPELFHVEHVKSLPDLWQTVYH